MITPVIIAVLTGMGREEEVTDHTLATVQHCAKGSPEER